MFCGKFQLSMESFFNICKQISANLQSKFGTLLCQSSWAQEYKFSRYSPFQQLTEITQLVHGCVVRRSYTIFTCVLFTPTSFEMPRIFLKYVFTVFNVFNHGRNKIRDARIRDATLLHQKTGILVKCLFFKYRILNRLGTCLGIATQT